MATREAVFQLHQQNPEWTAREIAAALECNPGYVRATAQRMNIKLLPGKRESILSLGYAARDAGLTVADIDKIAAERAKAPRS